jgi:hypothetical protein
MAAGAEHGWAFWICETIAFCLVLAGIDLYFLEHRPFAEAIKPFAAGVVVSLIGFFPPNRWGKRSIAKKNDADATIELFFDASDPNCYQPRGFVERIVVGGNVPSDETIYRIGVRSRLALERCRLVLAGSEPTPHDPGRHRVGLAMRPRIPSTFGSGEFSVNPGAPAYVDILQEISPQANPLHEAAVIRLIYNNEDRGKSTWFLNGDYIESFRLEGPTIQPVTVRLSIEFDDRERRWRVRAA